MATIKGQNLRILIGPDESHLKCIAAARSCAVHVAAVVGEADTKDSDNEWAIREITGMNWDVQVDALVTTTDDGAITTRELMTGETYVLRFSQTTSTKNRTQVTNRMRLTGEAILADLQLSAQNKEMASFSAKFIGDGAITQYQ